MDKLNKADIKNNLKMSIKIHTLNRGDCVKYSGIILP